MCSNQVKKFAAKNYQQLVDPYSSYTSAQEGYIYGERGHLVKPGHHKQLNLTPSSWLDTARN